MKEKPCKICGKLFSPECASNTLCKSTHYNNCPICGKQIIWNSTRKVEPCSKECRKEQTRRKNIEKYGVEHPMQSKEVQAHHKAAMKEKYGVESPLQSEEIKKKAIETNLNKFGTEWALGNKDIHAKIKGTMSERYGAPTTLESEILRKKIEQTCLDRYGVTNPGSNENIRKKITNTNFLKYNVSNPMQNPEISAKAVKTRIETHGQYWTKTMSLKSDETRVKNSRIPNSVRAFGKLLEEKHIKFAFNCSLEPEVTYDIALPNEKVLIDIDPTYTHNTIGNHYEESEISLNYHRMKTNKAKEAGYRCIHVFDWDDWSKIVGMLEPRKPISAKECTLYKLNKDVAYSFLENYHLMGSVSSDQPSLSLGLTYQGELVECMTFITTSASSSYDVELARFCCKTGYAVCGGTQKLFQFAVKKLGLDNIISCCYLDKFKGDIYSKLGMDVLAVTDPQEIWSKDDRKLVSGHSVDRLELLDQGWLPVYDCGKIIFEYRSNH